MFSRYYFIFLQIESQSRQSEVHRERGGGHQGSRKFTANAAVDIKANGSSPRTRRWTSEQTEVHREQRGGHQGNRKFTANAAVDIKRKRFNDEEINNENMAGNRTNVLNRWGHRDDDSKPRKPRTPFKGKPQYSLDDLYISPFTHELSTDELGRQGYISIEKNLTPTGIEVMDQYLQSLHKGKSEIATFCNRYGAKTSDLDGLVFLLTGMSNLQFRASWIVRCADELLRFTDMDVQEIARRSSAGSRSNLYLVYERDFNCSPSDRRKALRKDGDLKRYRIVE